MDIIMYTHRMYYYSRYKYYYYILV